MQRPERALGKEAIEPPEGAEVEGGNGNGNGNGKGEVDGWMRGGGETVRTVGAPSSKALSALGESFRPLTRLTIGGVVTSKGVRFTGAGTGTVRR